MMLFYGMDILLWSLTLCPYVGRHELIRNHELGEIALRVKMLVTRSRTERPRDLYYSLVLVFGVAC